MYQRTNECATVHTTLHFPSHNNSADMFMDKAEIRKLDYKRNTTSFHQDIETNCMQDVSISVSPNTGRMKQHLTRMYLLINL